MTRPTGMASDRDGMEWEVGPGKGRQRLTRLRWGIFLGLALLFSLLTFQAVTSGSPGNRRERPVLLTTVGTLTGPYVGAIARNGQGCCVAASTGLVLFCAPVLLLGVALQVIPLPFRRGQSVVRLGAWTLGWLVWFLGGTVSFFHALS